MAGCVNEILPKPTSQENEDVIQDLLKRKMAVSLDLAVEQLHAMEKRFGP